ncbi:pyridoxamine 5'-phosphate oxidase family protein [Winogradskyella sp. A3E31]|uniref:pyridoxamine 5'-phosphate oxidase family protein n=1 Tax=Winogradskyella sp. A3E31 TaxID=3349637 RepID=UPI00398B02BC
MRNINKPIYVVFALVLLIPLLSFSQNSEDLDSLRHKRMKAAREIMTSTKTCALITLDEEGRPRVRAMEPFIPESDFTVWFGTNTKSRKITQIKKDPKVTLYYLDSDGSGYVMIHGIAQIVNDQKEKDKRWKVGWENFYTNKNEDFILLKVVPEWMEVFSFKYGLKGDPITWEVPKVIFD